MKDMKKRILFLCLLLLMIQVRDIKSIAEDRDDTLPVAGISYELDDGTSYDEIYIEKELEIISADDENVQIGSVLASNASKLCYGGIERAVKFNQSTAVPLEKVKGIGQYENILIAKVQDYVNIRKEPDETAEVLGKLYNSSVGEYLGEIDGWYHLKSGSVEGYVKGEYCIIGDDAKAYATEVSRQIATVSTTTLMVRSGPSSSESMINLVPINDQLLVLSEDDGWIKVAIDGTEGYVASDFVEVSYEYVVAESIEEENQRLLAERQAAEDALAAANQGGSGRWEVSYDPPVFTGGTMGESVAEFACQFIGNPYVYGGSSLTDGADCSGFVMSVYAAFGVSLPHSSSSDRSQGSQVSGGLSNAQPGDIVCYSGHVAIYIGNGQIVHAANSRAGIIISNADYDTVLDVRRIF